MPKRSSRALPCRSPESRKDKLYKAADIDKVLSALGSEAQITHAKLWDELEFWAGMYLDVAHGVAHVMSEASPSDREKAWRGIRKSLEKFFGAWGKLPEPAYLHPADIVDPQTLSGEDLRFLREWETEPARFMNRISWLLGMVSKAEELAGNEKSSSGGNRPDHAKYFFCRALKRILDQALPENTKLTSHTDREADERIGELPDFLEAVFRPLKNPDSCAALEKTYRRATET